MGCHIAQKKVLPVLVCCVLSDHHHVMLRLSAQGLNLNVSLSGVCAVEGKIVMPESTTHLPQLCTAECRQDACGLAVHLGRLRPQAGAVELLLCSRQPPMDRRATLGAGVAPNPSGPEGVSEAARRIANVPGLPPLMQVVFALVCAPTAAQP